ncbi:MAG: YHS domain-containing protein [Candidatus Parvarchaeota archaeon]
MWSRSVKDPVCGMEVKKKTAKLTVEYKGKKYYFCEESCKKEGKKSQHGC